MRLTLRTLLAYLDDILEPGVTKEIGNKLQQSPVAMALASRIKEVMRRRRLGAPDLEGAGMGIDPNIVAQYLDNTLPLGQVGELEKVFLESDMQLAEVAACHQILTIVQGQPIEISQRSRERLYVLGPVETEEKLHLAAASDPVVQTNGETRVNKRLTESSVPIGPTSPTFEESLPEYLKQKPWKGKLLPIILIVALLVLSLGSIIFDMLNNAPDSIPAASKTQMREKESAPEDAVPEEPAEPVEVASIGKRPAELPAEEPKTESKPESKPGSKTESESPPVSTKVASNDVEGKKVASTQPPPENVEPEVTPVAPPPDSKPAPVAPPVPTETAPPAVAPKVPVEIVSVQAVSPDGVLLSYQSADRLWYPSPRNAELALGTVIACPEPFESVLEINQGDFRITLLGDTIVELQKPQTGTSFGLRLIRGRMILHAIRLNEKPWNIQFTIGPRSGVLEFNTNDTLCGIENLWKEPSGLEQPVPLADQLEGMYIVSGDVIWSTDEDSKLALNKGMFQRFLVDQMPLNFGPPISTSPDWLDPQRRKSSSTLRRWAKQFEKEFESNLSVDATMPALIRDSRPKIAELAIRCLALTENTSALVQALSQSDSEDARKAAAEGIRTWLGAGEGRGEILMQSLKHYYENSEDVAALYRLLWGYSVADAKTESASGELVDLLRSDHVEICELAIANLVRLTGRNFGYRALVSSNLREPAIKRWNDYLDREKTLIKADQE